MRSRFVGVAGWQKNSLIDFPRTVATVLFYSGCNLRCPYCHNPNLTLGPSPDEERDEIEKSEGIIKREIIAQEEILEFLEKRKKVIEGVVLSGGEPTIHQSLIDDIKEIRSYGYKIKLDTNGLLPGMIQQAAPDYLALDIKTIPSLYRVLLSCPYGDVNRRLEESIRIVKQMGDNAEVRITVSPGIVDKNAVMQIGEIIQGVSKVFLQPMQQRAQLLDPSYQTIKLIPREEIFQFRDILSEFVEKCVVRGE
jgi:pyruvate formate lyase activating enzyme